MSIEDRTKKAIDDLFGIELGTVTNELSLVADIGADSLDQIELVMALEDEFSIDIVDDEAMKCRTVGDVVQLICNYPNAA